MKVTPYTVILFSVFALRAPADDIAGNWKGKVVGGVRHKTISQATFDFKVDGNHLGGTAHIGNDESSYYQGLPQYPRAKSVATVFLSPSLASIPHRAGYR